MSIVAQPTISMSDERVAARLKRDVGITRAAYVLADALAVRHGEQPGTFSARPAEERDWLRRTVRSLIEIYETSTGITPENVDDARRKEEEARLAAAALQNRLSIERSVAAVAAAERGHELGPWHSDGPEVGKGIERASCIHCRRVAVVDIHQQPPHAGLALTTGCLSDTERRDVRIATPRRPDAFLSEAPNAAREGDR